jgi:uncharacterized SAM-binding protein YcdF (DUF218 family)
MYILGKILAWLASPLILGLGGFVVALAAMARGRTRRAAVWGGAAMLWLLVWSSPLFYTWFGCTLERAYPPRTAEALPSADAIVVLGGGMSTPQGPVRDPDLSAAADRVWFAARLYRAGKAPVVVPSGEGEAATSAVLLADLGVPAAAIRVENASRNTAENAVRTRAVLQALGAHRVLLVTSAFHMRRARMIFERAGVAVIPAATDYEATLLRVRAGRWSLTELLPSPEALSRNTYILKEYLGYAAYRWFR